MEYYHSKYGSQSRTKKGKSRFRKFILWFIFVLILIASAAGYWLYNVVFEPNIWTPDGKEAEVFIPTGSNWEDVKIILYKDGFVVHRKDFEWWAEKKNLPSRILPGRYLISDGLSNNDLVDLLRSGNQTPVNVIFNNIRDIYQLAQKVSHQIEADSASIIRVLKDTSLLVDYGLNEQTVPALFIPNTYEMYWNTNARDFINRMHDENVKFWNSFRTSRAAAIGLSKTEVITLASIVEKESNKNDEKPAIAGVYINRLESGWRLQADPTVIFAVGDFSIRRVLNVHKKYDSPYNTYRHLGLPPGPICIPSISSIDAVLNYEDHGYFYFCAKDDMSGYHVFAKTGAQHNRNAKKYQQALNDLKIYE